MMRYTISFALLVVCACSNAGTLPPAPSAPKAPPPTLASATDGGNVIEATSVGTWRGKPPLKRHAFDVVLHNPSHEPRWIVLPTMFPYESSNEPAPGGSEGEIRWLVLSKQPRVVIARGGQFLAIRLAGDARVGISPIWIESWWKDLPKSTELRVLVAREVTIGGTALAALADSDPTSASAMVIGAKDVGDERVETIWHPPGDRASPIAFDVESSAVVTVPLVRDEL